MVMGIGRTFMGEVSSAPLSLRVENPAEGGGVHMDDEAIFWDLCSECGSEASAVSPLSGEESRTFYDGHEVQLQATRHTVCGNKKL